MRTAFDSPTVMIEYEEQLHPTCCTRARPYFSNLSAPSSNWNNWLLLGRPHTKSTQVINRWAPIFEIMNTVFMTTHTLTIPPLAVDVFDTSNSIPPLLQTHPKLTPTLYYLGPRRTSETTSHYLKQWERLLLSSDAARLTCSSKMLSLPFPFIKFRTILSISFKVGTCSEKIFWVLESDRTPS